MPIKRGVILCFLWVSKIVKSWYGAPVCRAEDSYDAIVERDREGAEKFWIGRQACISSVLLRLKKYSLKVLVLPVMCQVRGNLYDYSSYTKDQIRGANGYEKQF